MNTCILKPLLRMECQSSPCMRNGTIFVTGSKFGNQAHRSTTLPHCMLHIAHWFSLFCAAPPVLLPFLPVPSAVDRWSRSPRPAAWWSRSAPAPDCAESPPGRFGRHGAPFPSCMLPAVPSPARQPSAHKHRQQGTRFRRHHHTAALHPCFFWSEKQPIGSKCITTEKFKSANLSIGGMANSELDNWQICETAKTDRRQPRQVPDAHRQCKMHRNCTHNNQIFSAQP